MPLPQLSEKSPRRVRVLFVTDEMEVGGTQRQIVLMAKSLDRTRFEATVVYFCNRSFLVDQLEEAGIRVVEISKRSRFSPGFVLRLVQFLRDGQFDVMHCFAFTGELWGAIARRLLPAAQRPALITSVRNKYDWYTPLQWKLKRWSALQSVSVIANSRAGGEHAREQMHLPAGAVDVVYNGVADISGGKPQSPKSIKSGHVTALFVGRLVEQKNVPLLIRAMKRIIDDGLRLDLKVAGDGPLRSEIEAQIRELGLAAHIEMLGERNDTPALMADADFVISPSLREGLSNVVLEAMMMGRPVIASAVGGSVELVDHEITGLLFPSGDERALAQAMTLMVRDQLCRERLGVAARQRAINDYTVEAMVQKMESAYQNATVVNTPKVALGEV
jgi:glycosyltransferase involved in cell wall biosynthesis